MVFGKPVFCYAVLYTFVIDSITVVEYKLIQAEKML